MKAPAKVYIQNDQSKFMISPAVKKTIKEAVYATLIYLDFECPDTQVSVTLTDNEKIHEINLKHRQKDSPTDVLSFPMIDWEISRTERSLRPKECRLCSAILSSLLKRHTSRRIHTDRQCSAKSPSLRYILPCI